MLSVFSTLKETLSLWVRNFWYLVILTLVIGTPIIFLSHYGVNLDATQRHSCGPSQLIGLICSLGSSVLMAANPAALLGLMQRPTLGKTVGTTVLGNVKAYTWTLFRLYILLALIAIIALIPFLVVGKMFAVLHVFVPIKIYTFFCIGLCLVLLKYALAYPLIVVENLGAWDALKRSWVMTKGHFCYVVGCYLFLGVGNWMINWLFSAPLQDPDFGPNWVWLATHLGLRLIDTSSIILSWCMYLRIKETDQQALPAVIPSTLSSPESPSASQSA